MRNYYRKNYGRKKVSTLKKLMIFKGILILSIILSVIYSKEITTAFESFVDFLKFWN